MSQYILRLDDASDYMDTEKWQRMEDMLDKYGIKPLVGIIPDNQDSSLVETYKQDSEFWNKTARWKEKGWELALHGCYHKYTTKEGGINPVNKRSEFAGVPLEKQKRMIRHGVDILKNHEIEPKVFFAPSHTFDKNTLIALNDESDIRVVSDTIANDVYYENGFYFIPQQSGRVRKLPFRVVTFCYHPNTMQPKNFAELEGFLQQYAKKFVPVQTLQLKKRRRGPVDRALRWIYFARR